MATLAEEQYYIVTWHGIIYIAELVIFIISLNLFRSLKSHLCFNKDWDKAGLQIIVCVFSKSSHSL